MSATYSQWMATWSGGRFWPLDPRREDIRAEDIAQGLAMTVRYNGQCSDFYSVAEHSVLVSQFVSPENAMWALLHDASEAYIGDMVRPAKVDMPDYQRLEASIMAVVCGKFGLEPRMPDEVDVIDKAIIADERQRLFPHRYDDWTPRPLLGANILCLPWQAARAQWLSRFYELGGKTVTI